MSHERRESLGATIRTLREAKGVSRADLASAAGISIEMLAKIEQGRKGPSAKTLTGLAKALEVETPDLAQRASAWEAMSAAGASTAVLRSGALTGGLGAAISANALRALIPGVGLAATAGGAAALAIRSELRNRKRVEAALITSIQGLSDEQLLAIAQDFGVDVDAAE